MALSTAEPMAFFSLYRETYCHCHLQYKDQEGRERPANIMNLHEICQEIGNNLKNVNANTNRVQGKPRYTA